MKHSTYTDSESKRLQSLLLVGLITDSCLVLLGRGIGVEGSLQVCEFKTVDLSHACASQKGKSGCSCPLGRLGLLSGKSGCKEKAHVMQTCLLVNRLALLLAFKDKHRMRAGALGSDLGSSSGCLYQ